MLIYHLPSRKGGHLRKGTERFLKISKIVLDNQDGLRYDIRVAAEKQRRGRPARQASETVNPTGFTVTITIEYMTT